MARLLFHDRLTGETDGAIQARRKAIRSSLTRSLWVVWGTLVDLRGRTLDEFGLELAGVVERHDLVVVALDDERRNVDLLQVLRLVRLGERLDAEVGSREAG